MIRGVTSTLVALFFTVAAGPAALAQAPIIVDLAVTALRGLAFGVGQQAGQEIYSNLRGGAASPGPRTPSDVVSTPAITSSPQTVPIEPATPPDGLHWKMNNLHGGSIVLQFYSTTRRGYHWPAGNRAYLLKYAEPVTIRLRCMPGEKICFGGAIAGKYWGTGLRLRHSCVNCCRLCGSEGRGVAFR